MLLDIEAALTLGVPTLLLVPPGLLLRRDLPLAAIGVLESLVEELKLITKLLL